MTAHTICISELSHQRHPRIAHAATCLLLGSRIGMLLRTWRQTNRICHLASRGVTRLTCGGHTARAPDGRRLSPDARRPDPPPRIRAIRPGCSGQPAHLRVGMVISFGQLKNQPPIPRERYVFWCIQNTQKHGLADCTVKGGRFANVTTKSLFLLSRTMF